jgi:hypothetical protein
MMFVLPPLASLACLLYPATVGYPQEWRLHIICHCPGVLHVLPNVHAGQPHAACLRVHMRQCEEGVLHHRRL